jgi:hypothetical protein
MSCPGIAKKYQPLFSLYFFLGSLNEMNASKGVRGCMLVVTTEGTSIKFNIVGLHSRGAGYLILVHIFKCDPPKHRRTSSGLNDSTSQRIILFITPALKKAKENLIKFPSWRIAQNIFIGDLTRYDNI